uniref:Uncharacterized protein n=1 Tax=Anguilla anguilla TaxID=7936 RepID=A0A0E9SXZ8_ANGAN
MASSWMVIGLLGAKNPLQGSPKNPPEEVQHQTTSTRVPGC